MKKVAKLPTLLKTLERLAIICSKMLNELGLVIYYNNLNHLR